MAAPASASPDWATEKKEPMLTKEAVVRLNRADRGHSARISIGYQAICCPSRPNRSNDPARN